MVRHPLVVASSVLLLAGCGAAPDHSIAPAPASPYAAEYAQAGAEFDVPPALLQAIARTQTGEHVASADAEVFQAGPMGLLPDTVAEASSHLGLDAATIAGDPLANVRAAAWIVHDRRLQGASWNTAALAVTGITDPGLKAHWLQKLTHEALKLGLEVEAIPAAQAPDVSSFAGADYPGATWTPASSSNYTVASRTAANLYYVIIHDIEGSYEGAISWFQNPASQVSAHFVVSFNGDVTQMVLIKDIAWHAGNWTYNTEAVGIEHEGYASANDYTEQEYEASATLTRWIADNYDIAIDRNHIIGHYQVPYPSTHTDPGPYWDWDHYMDLVNNGVSQQPQTASLVGYVRVGDIYNGAPIAGATVTIDGGQTATTDASGYYQFDGLPFGTYTVTATADGYDPGVDSKDLTTASTYWKSIALEPSSPGNPDGEVDPNLANVGPDTGASHGGCSVDFGAGSPAIGLLGLAFVLASRLRRRAER